MAVACKQCTKCGIEKPATTEHFAPHKECKFGVSSVCRECLRVINKNYNAKRVKVPKLKKPRGKSIVVDGQKLCLKCGDWKPATIEYFTTLKSGLGGLFPHCRDCVHIYAKEYTARPEVKARQKDRQQEHKEDRKIYDRERHITKRRDNPDYHEHRKKWYQDYKKTPNAKRLRTINSNKRHARKSGAEGTYTAADIELQYKSQKGKCWWCGKKLNGEYHIDHRIALARGGSNWPNNLCCSCGSCNCSKSDRMPWEWCNRLL